ncbi:MAG: HAD family hydrolase [Porticoccaceae bacterium]
MNHRYKLLIFDWDGTLCDSVTTISTCIQHAAKQQGLPIPSFAEASNIIGLGLKEAVTYLFPNADDEVIAAVVQSYSSYYREKNAGPTDFFPHVLEVLAEIKKSGYLIAVATGKSRAGLNRAFAASDIEDLFHDSRCADETASKPNPLMLAELLDKFGVSADQALMVGDTEFDLDMAQQINMPRLGVTYGAHAKNRLLKFEPIACIDCFSDLVKYI